MKRNNKQTSQNVSKWGITFITLARTFPAEKLMKYLQMYGVNTKKDLDMKSIEEMFLYLRDDFIKGNLDLDEFALICNELHEVMRIKHFDDNNPSLASTLYECNELSFDIRSVPKQYKDVVSTLKTIYEYKPELGAVRQGSSAPI